MSERMTDERLAKLESLVSSTWPAEKYFRELLQALKAELERTRELEAEVARLREVIWRNADPFDASDEDAEIIEEIARSITP